MQTLFLHKKKDLCICICIVVVIVIGWNNTTLILNLNGTYSQILTQACIQSKRLTKQLEVQTHSNVRIDMLLHTCRNS